MKYPLLILAPLLLGAGPSPAASAREGAASQLVADDITREEFMRRFREAMSIGETKAMARLVSQHQAHAVQQVMLICEAISVQSSDRLEKEIAALRTAFKTSMRTDFVQKVYEYFSLLKDQLRKQRVELKNGYIKLTNKFIEAQAEGSVHEYPGIAVEYEQYASAFSELGDQYHASQCYLNYAVANDTDLRGDEADLQAAWRGYRDCLAAREKLELHDSYYKQTSTRIKVLEAEGFGVEVEAGGALPGEAVFGTATSVAMGFELMDAVDSLPRPSWCADELYPVWSQVYMRARGSTTIFPAMEKSDSPTLIRAGASEVLVDLNGDGEGDVEVPLTGNVERIELQVGQGEARREWAVFTRVGNERDYYQGIQTNLAPSDMSLSLYVACAGAMRGVIGGSPVLVFDDNLDGVYGSAPKAWGHQGVISGDFQQDMDAIQVGKEKRARPWSELQEVDGAWYKLEAAQGGKQLSVTPAEITTGQLSLSYKGPPLQWLVIKGTGEQENCYFDLLQNGKKAVDVPIGTYQLFSGLVAKGKRRQTMKALILPGESEVKWKVKAGEKLEVKIGQPFGFDFDFVDNGASVTVQGATVCVIGAGGERYERLWNCRARPEASVRSTGSKRGSKPEDMKVITDQPSTDPKWWSQVWFPLDIELEKKSADAAAEVQLIEKKHKLFGKIESIWRG